jgi:hypothetical protein
MRDAIKKRRRREIGKSTKSIAKRFVPSSKASLAVEAILYKFPTIALLLRAPTLPSFISTLLIVRPEKRSAPESKNYGAVQRSTSPPKIRRPETLRHTPQTGPLRLRVRRLRRHRPRHKPTETRLEHSRDVARTSSGPSGTCACVFMVGLDRARQCPSSPPLEIKFLS